MKLSITVKAGKETCGSCHFREQHSNLYPNDYRCRAFRKWLKTEGDWKTKLTIFRCKACLDAERKQMGENGSAHLDKEWNMKLPLIESALKFGINVAGAHRHTNNFNKLIEALSLYLRTSH